MRKDARFDRMYVYLRFRLLTIAYVLRLINKLALKFLATYKFVLFSVGKNTYKIKTKKYINKVKNLKNLRLDSLL